MSQELDAHYMPKLCKRLDFKENSTEEELKNKSSLPHINYINSTSP